MKKVIICITVLFLSGLFCAHTINEENMQYQNSFIIWSHSDIQPRSPEEKIQYEKAVKDISTNFTTVDMALMAGDIVQFSHFNEIYPWYLNTRKKAPVKEWLDIAGNHDWRAIGLYKKYINRQLHYSVTKGNLLILMMSNEIPGRPTYISDETFKWWKDMVVKNQDKIIITVTHGAIEGSGIMASHLNRLIILDSKRFRDILKKYRMDIWLSGHSHFPGWMPNMHNKNKDTGNTVFIDLGAIREDFLTQSESLIFFFRQDFPSVIIKRRNHGSGKYMSDDLVIPLSHPFSLH